MKKKKKKKKKRQQLYAEWDAKQTKAPKETPSSAPPSSRIQKKLALSPAITNRDHRYSEQEIAQQQKKRGNPEES